MILPETEFDMSELHIQLLKREGSSVLPSNQSLKCINMDRICDNKWCNLKLTNNLLYCENMKTSIAHTLAMDFQ